MKNINKNLTYISTFLVSFMLLSPQVLAIEEDTRTQTNDMTTGCEIIPDGVLDILTELWYVILIAGPVIFIIMSLIDIFKTLTSSDEKAFRELLPRIVKRVIGVLILILLPVLINFILGIINSNFSSCVN